MAISFETFTFTFEINVILRLTINFINCWGYIPIRVNSLVKYEVLYAHITVLYKTKFSYCLEFAHLFFSMPVVGRGSNECARHEGRGRKVLFFPLASEPTVKIRHLSISQPFKSYISIHVLNTT